jgi:hypothetical protein
MKLLKAYHFLLSWRFSFWTSLMFKLEISFLATIVAYCLLFILEDVDCLWVIVWFTKFLACSMLISFISKAIFRVGYYFLASIIYGEGGV